jgi:hypothetical protein
LCPKEKGIQSQNHFQLRGKTWTAPGPNNNRYITDHGVGSDDHFSR